MKVLVLTRIWASNRKNMDDHIHSFKRYVDGVEFFYCDFFLKLPLFLQWIKWDGIILHYTLLANRWDKEVWDKYLFENICEIKKLHGIKVAIPQDEYAEASALQELFKICGVHTVYTCLLPIDYDKIYPLDATGLKYRFTTYAGFVDEASWQTIEKLSQEIKSRDIHIGYRARQLPFWLGRHGQIKSDVAKKILQAPNQSQLKLDVSTDPKDVFYGDDWMRFLLRCRCVVGCLGGASLYDSEGVIRKQIDDFVEKNPDATFDEVEKLFFPGKDYNLNLFALSPRHFECAMTKTCQILVEGDYQGVFIPGKHYIELKKDYSNLKEVFEKASDREFCDEIAENAYRDIALSGKYTYRVFANEVIDHIKEHATKHHNPSIKVFFCRNLLKIHTLLFSLRHFFFRCRTKIPTKSFFPKLWKKFLRSIQKQTH